MHYTEHSAGNATGRLETRASNVEESSVAPAEEYRRRLDRAKAEEQREQHRFLLISNLRLAIGVAAVVLAILAFGKSFISGWWLLAPLLAFIISAILHERVERRRSAAARVSAYYEAGLARMEDRWAGKGNPGERFRDPGHVYAEDLDLFGKGSLFELLSTARTGAGERTLARWLLAPAGREDVIDRQKAAAEVGARLDLREALTLAGDDVRGAVDAESVAAWGSEPPITFFPGARILALALAIGALVAAGTFFAGKTSLRPLLVVILLQVAFRILIRDRVQRIAAAVTAPAYELQLLGLLLERLEREPFQASRLVALAKGLETDGAPASRRIRRLQRLVELLYSGRNQFFAPLAAAVIWTPQWAMAVEAWRQVSGRSIGRWMAAVGEFEALCSLGGYAFERPRNVFPDLLSGDEPEFDAQALNHPLIPVSEAIANDVQLGGEMRLLLVSGSNMSGKSTLLRAVGLATVLAWAGAPVPATRLSISRLRVGASLRTVDSVTDHRSRFYAEISRLREIMDLARQGLPVLFLLDELLSGTNSHDRRIGAEALVRGLVEHGAIGMVTTHDLALAGIADALGPRARNVHFEDHLENGEMRFDYRLRPGVVERSNALELMRSVGLEV